MLIPFVKVLHNEVEYYTSETHKKLKITSQKLITYHETITIFAIGNTKRKILVDLKNPPKI